MKSKFLLLVVLGLLVSGSCFAVATKVNRGPIHARSFNFVSRTGKADPSISDNREAVHKLIQSAVTRNLAARGVKRVNGGGDLAVRYLLIKGDNASTTAIRDYFGPGEDLGDLHDKAQKAYTGSKNPDHFEAGTLLLDLVDGRNFKLMKRGYATRALAPGISSSARAARIQQAVDEILRDVKIVP
jgi:hypothetical protein